MLAILLLLSFRPAGSLRAWWLRYGRSCAALWLAMMAARCCRIGTVWGITCMHYLCCVLTSMHTWQLLRIIWVWTRILIKFCVKMVPVECNRMWTSVICCADLHCAFVADRALAILAQPCCMASDPVLIWHNGAGRRHSLHPWPWPSIPADPHQPILLWLYGSYRVGILPGHASFQVCVYKSLWHLVVMLCALPYCFQGDTIW